MGANSSSRFSFNKSKPFNGIFSYLNKINNGNSHLKGILEIKVSSLGVRCVYKPEEVINSEFEGEWSSENINNSWFLINFKDKKVDVRGYSIKTYNGSTNGTHLKSWKLEGSNDEETWIKLDEVTNCIELNKPKGVFSKEITSFGYFQYIRIFQTDKNCFGSNTMTISNLELFGNLN